MNIQIVPVNLKQVARHCFIAELAVDIFPDSVVNHTFACLLPALDEIAEHSVLEA